MRGDTSITRLIGVLEAGTVTNALFDSIGAEFTSLNDSIQYVIDNNNIDNSVGEELDDKWGALLNRRRMDAETDDEYRERMKSLLNDLVGGTTSAIKYAVANAIGVNDGNESIQSKVHIVDAWEFVDGIPTDPTPGNAVCFIEWDSTEFGGELTQEMRDKIAEFVDNAKAAGVKFQIVFKVLVISYEDLGSMTYEDLGVLSYDELGG